MSAPVTNKPALYHHCIQVYEKMMETAVEEIEVGTNVSLTKWEGHLTKVIQECNLPQPYYSDITQALRKMGCIDQIKRGGGGGNSIWVMYQAPTSDLWDSMPEDAPSERARRATPTEQLAQQVKDLKDYADELIAAMATDHLSLVDKVNELIDRVNNLEMQALRGK